MPNEEVELHRIRWTTGGLPSGGLQSQPGLARSYNLVFLVVAICNTHGKCMAGGVMDS